MKLIEEPVPIPIRFSKIGLYPKLVMQVDTMVCQHFDITQLDLRLNTRMHHIVWPRQICMWLLRTHAGWAWRRIAQAYSCQERTIDHGTVYHAIKRVGAAMECEAVTATMIQRFSEQLKEAGL